MNKRAIGFCCLAGMGLILVSCSGSGSANIDATVTDYSELQDLAMRLRAAVDFASTEIIETIDDLDAGYLEIPDNVPVSATAHGQTVENGVITVTWRDDGSPFAGTTYILRATSFNYPIAWVEGGSCLARGFCASQLEP